MAKVFHVLILSWVACFTYGEAQATTITIDPLKTFLFTNNDPWSGNGTVAGSQPIALV